LFVLFLFWPLYCLSFFWPLYCLSIFLAIVLSVLFDILPFD
jgi:hypothetical protein